MRSIFRNFTFDSFITAVMVIVVLVAALTIDVQSDTWWQIRTGQYILQTSTLPTRDPFTFTVQGAYWPNHEWLAEVVFYLAFSVLGMPGVVVLLAAVLSGMWALMFGEIVSTGRMRAYMTLMGVAVQSMLWNVRPFMFSMFFLTLVVFLIRRPRWHWAYPLLFLIWANTHAGVAFGGLLMVIASLTAVIWDREHIWRWWAVTALSGLITLINPLGIGLWKFVLAASSSDPVRGVLDEWLPAAPMNPYSYPFYLMFLVFVFVLIKQRRNWQDHYEWTLIVGGLAFGLAGFVSIRHTAAFAIPATLIISHQFNTTMPAPLMTPARRSVHLLILGLMGLLAIGLIGWRWQTNTLKPALSPEITAYIRSCPGNLFNTYYGGGYILWAAPERPVFLDNRQDPFPPDFIFAAVGAESNGEYEALFSKYDISCALVPRGARLHDVLSAAGWIEVGHDDEYVVMRKGSK